MGGNLLLIGLATWFHTANTKGPVTLMVPPQAVLPNLYVSFIYVYYTIVDTSTLILFFLATKKNLLNYSYPFKFHVLFVLKLTCKWEQTTYKIKSKKKKF